MIAVLSIFFAITSPLQTAEDYVFTFPAVTNAIKGFIMGSSGDYGYMRYEDIAFLTEALAERDLFRWNSVSSNDFISSVISDRSNTVPKSVEIGALRIDSNLGDMYIWNANEMSDQPRVVDPAMTNYVETSSYQDSAEFYAYRTNVLEQVMTNGTVDVWSNAYPNPYFSSNIIVRTSVSNLISYEDYCMQDHVVVISSLENYHDATTLKGVYSKRAITNLFAIVNAMKYTVPKKYDLVKPEGNATYYHMWYSTSNPHNEITNTVTSTAYYVLVENYSYNVDRQFMSGGQWVRYTGYPKSETYIPNRYLTYPNNLNLKVVTPYPDIYSTYETYPPRIRKAFAFALVHSNYSMNKVAEATGVETVSESKNLTSEVMVPLGECLRSQPPENEKLCFDVIVPMDIYRRAAEKSGIPYLELNHVPSFISGNSPQWDSDVVEREKGSYRSSSESLSSDFEIYIIVELNPKTEF